MLTPTFEAPLPANVGDVLHAKYRLDRLVGRGGMGAVFAATHLHLDQVVAIKLLVGAGTSGRSARFLNEARAAARITSEHVVRILDADYTETHLPFLVLEFLEGRDLGAVLREQGALPLEQAVSLTVQALAGLSAAHALGIVHRDVKPANLFLCRDLDHRPTVKLLDFGIARWSAPGTGSMTNTGALLGSPAYMSPEQIEGSSQLDLRSDIWSIGVTLYELVSGELPFQDSTAAGTTARILRDAPRRSPHIPLDLWRLLERCFMKSPEDRFSSALELAERLTAIVETDERARANVERMRTRTSQTQAMEQPTAEPQRTLEPPWARPELLPRSTEALTSSAHLTESLDRASVHINAIEDATRHERSPRTRHTKRIVVACGAGLTLSLLALTGLRLNSSVLRASSKTASLASLSARARSASLPQEPLALPRASADPMNLAYPAREPEKTSLELRHTASRITRPRTSPPIDRSPRPAERPSAPLDVDIK